MHRGIRLWVAATVALLVASGVAIAAVSTLGYTGFLAGPPLIGFVAEGTTLRGGLALVVVSSAVVASLAGAFRPAGGSS